jgi:hypothetical protein
MPARVIRKPCSWCVSHRGLGENDPHTSPALAWEACTFIFLVVFTPLPAAASLLGVPIPRTRCYSRLRVSRVQYQAFNSVIVIVIGV